LGVVEAAVEVQVAPKTLEDAERVPVSERTAVEVEVTLSERHPLGVSK